MMVENTRLASPAGSLRGLRIIRSDTDSRLMVGAGNLLTHYRYQLCDVRVIERPGETEWHVRTRLGEADLEVLARSADAPAPLPAGSPFATAKDARRFAGPLAYTFDYEPETHSIIRVRGVRLQWDPQPVAVDVRRNSFLEREPFCRATPILANAFHVHDVAYRWDRGTRSPL